MSTHPYPTPAEIEAHYERKYDEGNYELLRRYAPQYRGVYQSYVQVLERALPLRSATVLDIGCFTGEFLQLAAERGAEVYGLELQPRAVEGRAGPSPEGCFEQMSSATTSPGWPAMLFPCWGSSST